MKRALSQSGSERHSSPADDRIPLFNRFSPSPLQRLKYISSGVAMDLHLLDKETIKAGMGYQLIKKLMLEEPDLEVVA
jgi:hypothetical protein